MPIKPTKRKDYPKDWEEIARDRKEERRMDGTNIDLMKLSEDEYLMFLEQLVVQLTRCSDMTEVLRIQRSLFNAIHAKRERLSDPTNPEFK